MIMTSKLKLFTEFGSLHEWKILYKVKIADILGSYVSTYFHLSLSR